jgi:predicted MFS family arabinose efflux permease
MALQRICDPMLPELSRVFAAPIGEASHVISFFAITYGLMQLFYGPVGDRYGKYRVVMLATMGCGVGSLFSAFSTDLPFLVATRIGTALAAAAIIPLSLAWVGDVVPYEHRQETLARVGLGTMLGIASGQLFGGLLTDTLGWRWAFAVMAAVFATVSLLLWRQMSKLNPLTNQDHVPLGFFSQLKQVAHNPWARTFLSLALVEGATVFGVLAVTAAHLHQVHHISLTLAGGTAALFGLGGVAYMATAKITIRRLGEAGLAQYGGAGFACAFLVIAFSPWWQTAVPACFVAGFSFAMFHNTMQAKATQLLPKARATGVTLFAGFMFLGQSLGVLVLAELFSHFNSPIILGADAIVVWGLGMYLSNAIAKRNATQADHA